VVDQLAERFTWLAMSDPTQISRPTDFDSNSSSDRPSSFPRGLHNLASFYQEFNSRYFQNSFKKLGPFPFGLHNMATSYQALLQGSISPA
jgi:hypothetical protein